MKKLITGLLLFTSFILLSSCVVVAERHFHYYDFTFENDSDFYIADWYLRTEDGRQEAKSSDFVTVRPHHSSKLTNVIEDDYRVFFSFGALPDLYYYTDLFYLDSDKVYYLYQHKYYRRSIINEPDNSEPSFYLMDSDGNVIDLQTEKK